MLDELACVCEASDCDRELGSAEFRLAFEQGGYERRVYECDCGSVTITLGRHR